MVVTEKIAVLQVRQSTWTHAQPKSMKKIILLFLLGFLARFGSAQDIHFSQYYNIPLNINPALTGVFKEDIRIAGNYRSQWNTVPVSYQTFSAAFDMKYAHPSIQNGYFAFGGVFNRDQAGDSDLSLSQISLSASYTRPLSEPGKYDGWFSVWLWAKVF